MTLIEVTGVFCQTQIESRGITAEDFEKSLPHSDAMLDAIVGAVVDFFPSGQASYVHGALTKIAMVEDRMRETSIAKMAKMIESSDLNAKIEAMTEREFQLALDKAFPISPLGEQSTTA